MSRGFYMSICLSGDAFLRSGAKWATEVSQMLTWSSAVTEGQREVLYQLKSCQLLRKYTRYCKRSAVCLCVCMCEGARVCVRNLIYSTTEGQNHILHFQSIVRIGVCVCVWTTFCLNDIRLLCLTWRFILILSIKICQIWSKGHTSKPSATAWKQKLINCRDDRPWLKSRTELETVNEQLAAKVFDRPQMLLKWSVRLRLMTFLACYVVFRSERSAWRYWRHWPVGKSWP